jgi:hypothetical protein
MLTLLCGGPVEQPFCNSLLVTAKGDLSAALGVLGDTGISFSGGGIPPQLSTRLFICQGSSFSSFYRDDVIMFKCEEK